MTITRKNPVREAFSSRSTGNSDRCYYDTLGYALIAFDSVLKAYNLCLDLSDLANFTGNEGRKVVAIHNGNTGTVGHAVLSWFRMESGRYEFIGYIT
jgi:hypothetical protein